MAPQLETLPLAEATRIGDAHRQQVEKDLKRLEKQRDEHLQEQRTKPKRRASTLSDPQSVRPLPGGSEVEPGTSLSRDSHGIAARKRNGGDGDEDHCGDNDRPQKKRRLFKDLAYYDAVDTTIITTVDGKDNPWKALGFTHRETFSVPELTGDRGYLFTCIEQAYYFWHANLYQALFEGIKRLRSRFYPLPAEVPRPRQLADQILYTKWTKKAAQEIKSYLAQHTFYSDQDPDAVGFELKYGRWAMLWHIVERKVEQSSSAQQALIRSEGRRLIFSGKGDMHLMTGEDIITDMRFMVQKRPLTERDLKGKNWLGAAMMCVRQDLLKKCTAIEKKLFLATVIPADLSDNEDDSDNEDEDGTVTYPRQSYRDFIPQIGKGTYNQKRFLEMGPGSKKQLKTNPRQREDLSAATVRDGEDEDVIMEDADPSYGHGPFVRT